ncbi:spore coat putative kinase YutH [Microbacteriaceae bacterium 4G12]
MMQEIWEHYQIQVNQLSMLGSYKSFWVRNKVYILVPVGSLQEEELVEMKLLSDYMVTQGDPTVAAFVPTVQGYYVSEIQNTKYCMLKGSRQAERQLQAVSAGKELAMFHMRGKFYPDEITELNRIGEWKSLWEKRLDQLEKFWQSKVANHPTTPFEQMFIDSFPYYLGLAENAIQYVVDTELDDEPQLTDAATICQQRFTPLTWSQTKRVKIPTEWIYDHPSRDLAEWIRNMHAEGGDKMEENIMQFLYEYESNSPLSSFGWRLLFARLLFPLHYFETVEGYFLTGNEDIKQSYQDQLETIISEAKNFERFLGGFFQMIRLPVQKLGIRGIDWMQI